MDAVRISDGREGVYARVEQAGDRWQITWETGLSVETGGLLATDGDRAVLEVFDLPTLRRVSALNARAEDEHRGERHEGQQQGQQRAGHGAKVGRRASRQQSGGRR